MLAVSETISEVLCTQSELSHMASTQRGFCSWLRVHRKAKKVIVMPPQSSSWSFSASRLGKSSLLFQSPLQPCRSVQVSQVEAGGGARQSRAAFSGVSNVSNLDVLRGCFIRFNLLQSASCFFSLPLPFMVLSQVCCHVWHGSRWMSAAFPLYGADIFRQTGHRCGAHLLASIQKLLASARHSEKKPLSAWLLVLNPQKQKTVRSKSIATNDSKWILSDWMILTVYLNCAKLAYIKTSTSAWLKCSWQLRCSRSKSSWATHPNDRFDSRLHLRLQKWYVWVFRILIILAIPEIVVPALQRSAAIVPSTSSILFRPSDPQTCHNMSWLCFNYFVFCYRFVSFLGLQRE